MLRFLGFLLALALILFGILAGGCSLLFTPGLFQGGEFGGSGMIPLWGTGLVMGAVGIYSGIWIIRNLGDAPAQPSADPLPDDLQDAPSDEPPPPPPAE